MHTAWMECSLLAREVVSVRSVSLLSIIFMVTVILVPGALLGRLAMRIITRLRAETRIIRRLVTQKLRLSSRVYKAYRWEAARSRGKISRLRLISR